MFFKKFWFYNKCRGCKKKLKVDFGKKKLVHLSPFKADVNAKKQPKSCFFVVERGGFEPPKSLTTDLQSAPFGHSGISPYGAGDWTRTHNLLITNQLLCQLSHVGICYYLLYKMSTKTKCQTIFRFGLQ